MGYPTEPKKVTIHDRLVAVLAEIVEGDDYFYTPDAVQGKATPWQEKLADYTLEVFFGGAEEPPMHFSGQVIEEVFTVVIEGAIRDRDGECQKALARALRDVRKAVLADMVAGTSGCLGAYALRTRLGAWDSAPGEGVFEGRGRFRQEFKITVSGDISSL